jgi:hypothetical protein
MKRGERERVGERGREGERERETPPPLVSLQRMKRGERRLL